MGDQLQVRYSVAHRGRSDTQSIVPYSRYENWREGARADRPRGRSRTCGSFPAEVRHQDRSRPRTRSKSDESSSHHNARRARRRPEADRKLTTRITSSACFLHQLPRIRRCQLLELMDSRLDGATTANLSCEATSELVWLLTKLRPNQRLTDLRVNSYMGLLDVMPRPQF